MNMSLDMSLAMAPEKLCKANKYWGPLELNDGIMRSSFVDAYPHFGLLGTSLAPYGSGTYAVVVIDSDGNVALGYSGGVGPGESYGSELLSNVAFTSDTTPWAATDSTLASVAGGQAGNCLQITIATGKTVGIASQAMAVAENRLYRTAVYVKKGTATNCQVRLLNGAQVVCSKTYTDAAWGQKQHYLVAPKGCTSITVQFIANGSSGQTSLFDTALDKVQNEATTAALKIYKDAGLTTPGWNLQSGFCATGRFQTAYLAYVHA